MSHQKPDRIDNDQQKAEKPQESRDLPRKNDPLGTVSHSNRASVGTGAVVGATTAGVVGGAAAGPVGVAVGSALGAVAGGVGMQTLAEAINPTVEVDFWTDECVNKNYYDPRIGPKPFIAAYRIGWEGYTPEKTFQEALPELRKRWEGEQAESPLGWSQAQEAMRDAWLRVASQYYPEDTLDTSGH